MPLRWGEGSDFVAVHESFRRLHFTSAPQLVSVRGLGKGGELKRVLSGVVVPTFVGLMSCGAAFAAAPATRVVDDDE